MIKISIKESPSLRSVFERLRGDYESGLTAGMTHVVEEVEARAVKETPVRTSNLVNSITSHVARGGTQGVVRAVAKYAEYVHEGTGLYGPHKRVIVPTTKKALFWPGAAHPVRSVKGMRPRPFFTLALKGLKAGDLMRDGIMAYLARRGW